MHRFAGGCAVVVAFGGVVDGVWRCTGAPDAGQFNYWVYLCPIGGGVALGWAFGGCR
ncbi:hypothetical protein [Nitrosomonas halophila]|uniref:hypothetical protein n=1 Tax=Nitrosomonas halophila TaxID=44576 RepID=UPI00159FD227|nr:hypothetical protein [Nitrosomonas halophila]